MSFIQQSTTFSLHRSYHWLCHPAGFGGTIICLLCIWLCLNQSCFSLCFVYIFLCHTSSSTTMNILFGLAAPPSAFLTLIHPPHTPKPQTPSHFASKRPPSTFSQVFFCLIVCISLHKVKLNNNSDLFFYRDLL